MLKMLPVNFTIQVILLGALICQVHGMINDSASNPEDGSSTPKESGNASAMIDPQAAHIQFLIAASQEPTFQAGLKVQRYGAPIVILLGLFGNTVSFLIMIQKHNRHHSTCIYLAALAVTDNLSLLTLGYLWVVTEFVPNPWSDGGCKTWVYVVFLMTAGSAFTLLDVTFDRFIAIRFPFKAQSWSQPKRVGIVLLVTYLCVAVFYIPMALMSAVVDGAVCAAFAVRSTASQVLSNINLIVLPIIPFIMILIMNILIILAVYKSQSFRNKDAAAQRQNMPSHNANGNNQELAPSATINSDRNSKLTKVEEQERSRNYQLTVMLLLISFAYLIIILPISLRVLAYAFIDITASTKTYGVYVLLYSTLNLLLFLNNAINFYLYCVSGSKFRSDLKALFLRKAASTEGSTQSTATSSNTGESDRNNAGLPNANPNNIPMVNMANTNDKQDADMSFTNLAMVAETDEAKPF